MLAPLIISLILESFNPITLLINNNFSLISFQGKTISTYGGKHNYDKVGISLLFKSPLFYKFADKTQSTFQVDTSLQKMQRLSERDINVREINNPNTSLKSLNEPYCGL